MKTYAIRFLVAASTGAALTLSAFGATAASARTTIDSSTPAPVHVTLGEDLPKPPKCPPGTTLRWDQNSGEYKCLPIKGGGGSGFVDPILEVDAF